MNDSKASKTQQINEYSLVDAVARTVFLSMVALLCLYSAVWMAQDIFPGWALSKKATVWLYGSVIFTVACFKIGIRAMPRWLQPLCGLSMSAVYAYILFRYGEARQVDLEDGACAIAMEFLEKLNRHLHTAIYIWRGKPELISLAFAFWTFVALLGLLLLSLLLCRHGILLLLPSAVFVAELLIGYIPQWKGMAMFFAALLFVHADGGNMSKTALRVHADKRKRYTQSWYLHWLPAGCLAGAAIFILFCSGVLTNATADQFMDTAPKVKAFQRNAEKQISDIWRNYFAPRQETVNNQTPHYTEKEMLRVTASMLPAEDVLLKGFCGTDYKNGNWICDRYQFANACADAGYEKEDAARELLQGQYQLFSQGAERIMMRYSFGRDFFSINVNEYKNTKYTVEHTGVKSRYAFVPYAVDYEDDPDKKQLITDAMVQKSWIRKTFSYRGWDHFAGGIDINGIPQEKISPVFQWYDAFAREAYLDTSDEIPTLNEYLEAMQEMQERIALYSGSAVQGLYVNVPEVMQSGSFNAQTWTVPENQNWLRLRYLQQEAAYAEEPSWRNLNRLQTALVIASTLKRYQTYSLELDPLPEGADPIDYFLMHSQKGYCVHFASAAVLLLREMGVPARYASGYVVRVREFQKKGDVYVASVKDSNAHAWVEIYLEQVGWVPIDVTPAAAATVHTNTESAKEAENVDGMQADEKETQTDTDETQTDTDETQTDADERQEQQDAAASKKPKEEQKSVWMRYSLVFVIAGVLFVILLIYGICRWIIHFYRSIPMKEIKAEKYSRAVRRMNGRIYRKMCVRSRMPGRNLSDAQYEHMLRNVYQEIRIEDWAHFMQIVLAAAYAQDEVSDKDAQFCWEIYQKIVKKKFENRKNTDKG